MNINQSVSQVNPLSPSAGLSEAQTARNSLQTKVDQVLQSSKLDWLPFKALLWEMSVVVKQHQREYGVHAECREQILDESARFLAKSGLPRRTDYSLVDPTGKCNAAEELEYQGWKRWIPSIVLDPSDLPELGKRTIAILSEKFIDTTSTYFPKTFDDESGNYIRRILAIKRELGASVSQSDVDLIDSMGKCLPALIAGGCHGSLLHNFPEVLSERPDVLAQAKSEYLSRALQDVEVRWYGDSRERLSHLLNTKERLQIPINTEDKEVVLRIMAREWSSQDNMQQRLVENFDISTEELKKTVIAGLSKEVSDWSYSKDDAGLYIDALKSVSEIMTRHEITTDELSFDVSRKLPIVLQSGSFELTHFYLKTFSVPLATLTAPEYQLELTNILEDALTFRGDIPTKMPAAKFAIFRQWLAEGLREPIMKALCNVGNSCLENSGRYAFSKLISYIHASPSSFYINFFIEGARKALCSNLSSGDLESAQSIAREFKLELKAPEFKAAAIEGITKIFDCAKDGWWDRKRFEGFTKACGLTGVIDDDRLRNSIKPIIVSELNDGSARALNMVSWILNRFRFKEPMPGAEMRAAAINGLASAIGTSNGPAIRMVCTRIAKELTTQDTAEVVDKMWHLPEGKMGCLENIRYLPEATKHHLNRALALADYERDIGIAGPVTYDRYMEFYSGGRDVELKGFVKVVRKEMASLITSEPQNRETLQSNPRYRELILTIFPNNWGPDASFESTESCSDRSTDLNRFRIRSVQSFTLAEGVQMQLRPGAEYDAAVSLQIDDLINNCLLEAGAGGFSPTNLRRTLLNSLAGETEKSRNEAFFQAQVFPPLCSYYRTRHQQLPSRNC